MIVSVNWLKKFVDIDMPIDELVTLIGARLVEVEGTEDLSEKYKDVIASRVVSAEKMENSDHLSVVYLDDGGVVQGVERNDQGYVQVVCGAPNVREGITVAWLPPKSIVPETYGTDEPFELAVRPLRGVVSNGMIASARELDLYDEHDGILEIDKECAPGASFADLYELNDTLIDIENKSLTHRPDAFGLIGFAREVAGIQGKAFTTPAWLQDLTAVCEGQGFEAPAVAIEDQSLSQRFQAIVIDGAREDVASDIQMQSYLSRSGVRPVNALVDISNYLMLLTGQPTHMYDYEKLRRVAGDDFTVRVRTARPEERLILLDGKEITLDESDIVIAAGDVAVGLAGIMGGQSTMVDASTQTVVLEVATFDLYHMRSSQMRHGIFSEAVTRYTKGVPSELGRPVLVQAVAMMERIFGSRVASGIVEQYPGRVEPFDVTLSADRVNQVLGTSLSVEEIVRILENVEFAVEVGDGQQLLVTVPYWRNDIHIPEDVIEEIGRLSGFDLIEAKLPLRDFTAVRPVRIDTVRSALRSALVRGGLNEVLTYSFVHGDLLEKVGQSRDNSYRITNSISPDLQYYRQSLTPSLLQHVNPNIRLGFDRFGIFEFNKVHEKAAGLNDESVPVERHSVAAIVADAKNTTETAFYGAKQVLEYMLRSVGIEATVIPFGDHQRSDDAMFEPKRSARVVLSDGTVIGVVGEYSKAVQRAFKLPAYAAGFEVALADIARVTPAVAVHYSPLSRFPGVERDVCFKVDEAVTYADIYDGARAVLADVDLTTTVTPVDIYQPEESDAKNITIRISLVSNERTLTSEEVGRVIDDVCVAVTEKTKGEVI